MINGLADQNNKYFMNDMECLVQSELTYIFTARLRPNLPANQGIKNISHRYLDSGDMFSNFAFAFSEEEGRCGLECGSARDGKRSHQKVL